MSKQIASHDQECNPLIDDDTILITMDAFLY